MSEQFQSQFLRRLITVAGLYLIAWLIDYLIACLIALFIAKNCFCNCGSICY
nr:MAG TPA: Inovirus G7P protein [Caudoviricetes sp.]